MTASDVFNFTLDIPAENGQDAMNNFIQALRELQERWVKAYTTKSVTSEKTQP